MGDAEHALVEGDGFGFASCAAWRAGRVRGERRATPSMMPCAPLAATVACDDGTMAAELRYRNDLFTGTAECYDRFRPPYPPVLLDHLKASVPLIGTSRVLDLACGSGEIAFALAADVGELWAVDQEVEAIDLGRRKGARPGIRTPSGGSPRRPNASSSRERSISWPSGMPSIVSTATRWCGGWCPTFVMAAVWHCCGAACRGAGTGRGSALSTRRSSGGWTASSLATVCRRAGRRRWAAMRTRTSFAALGALAYKGKVEFPVVMAWTVDSLIGVVYSTSFLNRGVLHGRIDAFERDLQMRLLNCSLDGVFEQEATFAYELARQPV